MYPCPCPTKNICTSFATIRLLLAHIRDNHDVYADIMCTFCNKRYIFNKFRTHIKEHEINTNDAIEFPDIDGDMEEGDNVHIENNIGEDFNEQMEEDEEILLFESEEHEEEKELEPIEQMKAAVKRFSDSMLEKFLEFSKHPDTTEKSASFCCEFFLQIAEEAMNIYKPFLPPETINSIKATLKNDLLPMTSKYRRTKDLKERGLYIEPKKFTVNFEHYNAGSVDGLRLKELRQNVAMFSIKDTLLAVLKNPEIADALVMPSNFFNRNNKMNHPFCCTRAQNVYNNIGEDFLAIEIFLDEFTSTCPIGVTASIYKMVGCYIKVLNFPADLLSKLDHIFSCFIAHSSDIMADLQLQLEKTLIVELRRLETEGITFNYHGIERRFKVILLSLVGDNLGIHQLNGFTICFSGNNPCRMCQVTATSLKEQNELNMNAQKTSDEYDQLIASGNIQEMRDYGIDVPCAFNQLNHYHCMENVTADEMHDISEGHLKILLPLVIRDAISQGYSLQRINSAINSFGFIGPDNENPPRPIYLPPEKPDSGDSLKQTAHTANVMFKLLPLIFHFAGIRLASPIWTMFLKFQRIMDILWASEIDDPTIAMLEQLIKNYLAEFQANGGNMTVKPHLMLHYPRIIREMGPLLYLSAIRFEGKHRNFKAYAAVNRCYKNLPMTLASKAAIIFASVLYKMQKANYLTDLRRVRAQGKYKRGFAVVYGQNPTTKEPIFGKIQSLTSDNLLNLQRLNISEFHEASHCYKITEAAESIQISVDRLVCPEPLAIYCRDEKFIRMKYHLL